MIFIERHLRDHIHLILLFNYQILQLLIKDIQVRIPIIDHAQNRFACYRKKTFQLNILF